MYETSLFHYANLALVLTLWLSLPAILVASVLGLVVSLFQALTQIQDQTLQHAIKLIAVMVTLVATGPWLGQELLAFTEQLFTDFVRLPA